MKPRATRRTTKAELAKHVKSLERSAARTRKLTEALRESEERYRRLFDNASDLIATFTLDGVITSLNRAYEVVTGWSREELIGHHMSKMTAPESLSELEERTQRALAGERLPSVFEFIGLRKDGSRLPQEGRARFIRDARGNPNRDPGNLPGYHRAQAGRGRASASTRRVRGARARSRGGAGAADGDE